LLPRQPGLQPSLVSLIPWLGQSPFTFRQIWQAAGLCARFGNCAALSSPALAARDSSHRGLPGQTPLTAERVGPLSGNPIAGLAIEVAFIDWLPGLRIPPWPGAPRSSTPEAGDTSAVRPVSSPTLALQTHGQRRIDSRLTLGVQIPLARRPLEVVRTSARSVRQPRLSTTLACSVCTEGQPHGGLLPVTVTLTTFSWNPGALSRTA